MAGSGLPGQLGALALPGDGGWGAGAGVCRPGDGVRLAWLLGTCHPLERIRSKNSRGLKGADRAEAVQRALNSRDVRNVLDEALSTDRIAD